MKARLAVVAGLACLWIAAIAGRLYHLQVVRHDEFVHRAERQQQRVIELDPPRGTIYDVRGRELAVSIEVESVFAVPREVKDVRRAAGLLGKALALPAAELGKKLASDREFVWLARKLDPPLAAAVKALDLDGVYFLDESKRYYPLREVGAQVVGYVGTDNQGLAGLEAMYDKGVAGKPGRRTVLRDARQGMATAPDLAFSAAEPGRDLHLTLDATLQQIAEEELARAASTLDAKNGSVVLLDPATGAILAIASWPSFDPNRFRDFDEDAWRLRAISDAYEPGSTFKMVTAAAALEQGLVNPDELFDCEMGGITLAGVRIADHKPFGLLTFRDVIAKSSNVGAIKTALRLANKDFYDTIRAFGFGRTTGVDLPGESPGLLMPVERWPALAKAYISFGQGLSVTPLQLALAFAAVANGGRLLEPYVVAGRGADEGVENLHPQPVERGRPIDARTVATLTELLAGVTQKGGTGTAAVVAGYPVAGKTGTAQKALPGRGYLPNEYVASFVGFAPIAHPAIVGLVVLDDPRGTYHGGEAAAPVFQAIADKALLYLDVTPERERPERWPGEATGDAPTVEAALATPEPAPAKMDPAPGTLPDFGGLTARAALSAATRLRLRPVLNGQGVVARQDPPPGSAVAPGLVVELWLGARGADG